jgi:hypothetical protein
MLSYNKNTFFLRDRQEREINDLKGRITKIETDNQDLKQMAVKVCLLIKNSRTLTVSFY